MKKIISIISLLMIICTAMTVNLTASAAQYKSVSGTYNYSYAQEVLSLVNKERANYGLSALTMTESLTDGAMIRAAETTVSFSHTRPNGEQCFTAFDWSRAAGENIAYGQRSPQQVVTAWMNSSGHRANILSSNYTTIGIGCFEYGGTLYWSQAFSGGSGSTYSKTGTKSVMVNVSLTSGAQSYLVNSGASVETTTKAPETTTRKAETTTRAPATTTRKAETTTKKAETTTKKEETTTKKNETTTKKAETTTKSQSTSKYYSRVYSRVRSFIIRYMYFF